jgi:hypothetical protein
MRNQIETTYNVQLENRNRQTVFFRVILVFPIFIFMASLSAMAKNQDWTNSTYGILVIPVMLTLLFRGVYPSWLLSFNKSIFALGNRAWVYLALLTDEYPSLEDNQVVTFVFPEIDGGKKLHRALPLIKWLLAIPLYIVGLVYALYGIFLIFLAWIGILSTGKLSSSYAEGISSISAYWNRVYGYAILLVTDEYPSFSL